MQVLNHKTYTLEELYSQLESIEIDIANQTEIVADDMNRGAAPTEKKRLLSLQQQKSIIIKKILDNADN